MGISEAPTLSSQRCPVKWQLVAHPRGAGHPPRPQTTLHFGGSSGDVGARVGGALASGQGWCFPAPSMLPRLQVRTCGRLGSRSPAWARTFQSWSESRVPHPVSAAASTPTAQTALPCVQAHRHTCTHSCTHKSSWTQTYVHRHTCRAKFTDNMHMHEYIGCIDAQLHRETHTDFQAHIHGNTQTQACRCRDIHRLTESHGHT